MNMYNDMVMSWDSIDRLKVDPYFFRRSRRMDVVWKEFLSTVENVKY